MPHLSLAWLLLAGCTDDPLPAQPDPTTWGQACVVLTDGELWLARDGDRYAFTEESPGDARPLRLQPTALGRYLLYDDGLYVVGEDGRTTTATALRSDITEQEDGYVSAGEWVLEDGADGYRLQNRRAGTWLAADGALVGDVEEAAAFVLEDAEGCADFPELSLDAVGEVTRTTFEDGTLYGLADSHSHIFSNMGFGGGGVYHGAPFHPYGVEHALPDCEIHHGPDGRWDFFGFAYDNGNGLDLTATVPALSEGQLPEPNHVTDGYPEFTEWPDSRKRSTHQTQYHRWLERAWKGGLRLMVQHATSDQTICAMTTAASEQTARYSCDDMEAVDRTIDAAYEMQDWIDALHGGEGRGWFRIVTSPAQAREVIEEGKLAIVLGIETSNLFRCYLTPRPGDPVCDEDYVDAQLDEYYDRGVRAIFPVHKYGNQFAPGDGSNGFIEVGAFINSGHWTNKTQDCPGEDYHLPGMFDGGQLSFPGINEPREEYSSPAPNDMSDFSEDPLEAVLPYAVDLLEGAADGAWCEQATITPLGEHLLDGMMKRGMIVEVDHFSQWAYVDAYAILSEHDYPAAGTHNRHWEGRAHALGGLGTFVPARCQDADQPGASTASIAERVALIESVGGYPGLTFSFDYNGFAGGPGPRFGEEGCAAPQPNPVTYPFASYAGDVELTEPWVGNRRIDFDTEGMVHIGLMPELIEDLRADAVDPAELAPLFRGAEAYVRMWEKAEARAAELAAGE